MTSKEREVNPTMTVGEIPPSQPTPPPPAPVIVHDGLLVPSTSTELMRVIGQFSEGGGFPEIFDTAPKRLVAYNLGRALVGDKWQLALNNMYYHKGKLCIYGELPGQAVEHTGQVAQKDVYIIDKDYRKICMANKNLHAEPYAGVCIIQRKGRREKEFVYTIEDARTAGQLPAMKNEYKDGRRTGNQIPNDESPWNRHRKIMLMRKAMNTAYKFEFPDALLGVPVMEYDFDLAPDLESVRDVSESRKSEELANKIDQLE